MRILHAVGTLHGDALLGVVDCTTVLGRSIRASPPMLNKRPIPIFRQIFESDGTHRHRRSNPIFALRLDRQFGAQNIDPRTGDLDQYEPFQLTCPIQNKDRSRDSTDMIWIVISRE